MSAYLQLKKANCKNCHKCIRHCPVKAISFSEGRANILQDECILCGECVITCPQNAKSIRSDLDRAKELVAGGPVWASLAPSFIANYPGAGLEALRSALLALGFAGAEETAVGATIVKSRYDEMVRKKEQKVIISSCCHSINTLIQKHYPEALPFLAKVASPMLAHSAALKQRYPGIKTIFIGPCLAKKAEAEEYPGPVNCVLTFEELSSWLDEKGITLKQERRDEAAGKARLFPILGGILRSMDADSQEYSYIAIDGLEQCVSALEEITQSGIGNCFIEMSACKGSCIGGPAMHHRTILSSTAAIVASAGSEDFSAAMPEVAALKKEMPFLSTTKVRWGSEAVGKVLKKMGKTLPEHELNCGTCGYDTCRDKAMAVLAGKAEIEMCLPYLMEKAQSFSDNIIKNTPNGVIVVNEQLEVQQLNHAACKLMNINSQQEILGRQMVCVLDPAPFLEVLQTGANLQEKLTYLAEYKRYVTLTVVKDKTSNVLIGIMRDITEEEQTRNNREELGRKTIAITDQVIEKQMRAVQEIASLLGETTAETKVALTKLKETLQNE